jgi:hypothetical protein
MAGMLDDKSGVYYTERSMPAVASGANTAYEAVFTNPFGQNAYVDSIALVPIEAITGDATNSNNLNADLAAGTEIANLDFGAANDGVRGTPKAFTMTGTDAQRTIAANGCLLIEREEVGTQPVRLPGHVIRVGWKRI